MKSLGLLALVAGLVGLGFVAFLAFGVGSVFGEEKEIVGTQHDVSVPGMPVCLYCHLRRDPGGEALWTRQPTADTPFSGIKPLCFSCHDGTVSALNSTYAFDPSRPEHARDPGVRGQDCDRCHDAHNTGYGKFVKLPWGANFCRNCHYRAGPADHPVNVDAIAAGFVPADKDWDPLAGDFSGTRLWNSEGTGPGNEVKCLTCHSAHGAQPRSAINTVVLAPDSGNPVPICFNCHFRPRTN